MNALEFVRPVAADVAAAALRRGIVLNNIGPHILRVLPPLVCGEAEIDTLVAALDELSA